MPTRSHFDADLQTQFLQHVAALWPALKGSLTQVAKPCIRPNCRACAKGDKRTDEVTGTFQRALDCLVVDPKVDLYKPLLRRDSS